MTDEQERLKTIDKLHEIPTVALVANGISKTYVGIKNFNSLTRYGFYYAEKGTELVTTTVSTPFQRPIAAVDNVLCVTLDHMKEKTPIMYNTPTEIVERGKGVIFGTFIAQKLLGLMEIGCRVSETFLNAVPEVNLYEEDPNNLSDDKTLRLRTDLSLWKKRYHSGTKPLRYLKYYLRKLRKSLRTIRYTYKKRSRKQMKPDLIEKIKLGSRKDLRRRKSQSGLFGFFLSLPRRLLRVIGEMAHEYSKMVADKDTIIIDKALKKIGPPEGSEKRSPDSDSDGVHTDMSDDESIPPSSLNTPGGSIDGVRHRGGSSRKIGGGDDQSVISSHQEEEEIEETAAAAEETTSESAGEQETVSTSRETSPINGTGGDVTTTTSEEVPDDDDEESSDSVETNQETVSSAETNQEILSSVEEALPASPPVQESRPLPPVVEEVPQEETASKKKHSKKSKQAAKV